MKTFYSKLPDQPSALIRAALDDLKKCMADPTYVINMATWHKPLSGDQPLSERDPPFGRTNSAECSVCLAGAVLAQTFKMPASEPIAALRPFGESGRPHDPRNPLVQRFANDIDKLRAIDDFRAGAIYDGLISMGYSPDDAVPNGMGNLERKMAAFDKDSPEPFFRDMHKIADDFERCGH